MAKASTPLPAKLIVAMLSARRSLLGEAAERLGRELGPIDLVGEVTNFDFTDYYAEQMGGELLRQFVSFEQLIRPDGLARIKQATNQIEAELASAHPDGPARPLNLDPGYVTESKLVLASTKDFAHRIYLGEGIYGEVTLTYAGGRWRRHEHTFPDYASGAYDSFLIQARELLRRQLGRKERGG